MFQEVERALLQVAIEFAMLFKQLLSPFKIQKERPELATTVQYLYYCMRITREIRVIFHSPSNEL